MGASCVMSSVYWCCLCLEYPVPAFLKYPAAIEIAFPPLPLGPPAKIKHSPAILICFMITGVLSANLLRSIGAAAENPTTATRGSDSPRPHPVPHTPCTASFALSTTPRVATDNCGHLERSSYEAERSLSPTYICRGDAIEIESLKVSYGPYSSFGLARPNQYSQGSHPIFSRDRALGAAIRGARINLEMADRAHVVALRQNQKTVGMS